MTSKYFLPREKHLVADHCRHFMVEAYKYAMSCLPVRDLVLKNAEIVHFNQRCTAEFESLLFFVEKFPPFEKKTGT